MAKIVKIVSGLRRCVLNISNSLPNYTASHAKDSNARFSLCQQRLADRPPSRVRPVLSKSSRTVFFHICIGIINKNPPPHHPPINLRLFILTKFSDLNFACIFHLSICVICQSSSFVVSRLM